MHDVFSAKRDATQVEFDGKRRLIAGFRQAGTEFPMNLVGSIDDLASECVYRR